MKLSIKQGVLATVVTIMSVQAYADLNIQEGGKAKISWGGESSLSNAQSIMYENADSWSSKNYDDEDYINPKWFTTEDTSSYSNYGTGAYHTGSKGVMVMDAQTGKVIYEKNADTPRPIASISKVMTAVIVMESGADMNEMLTIHSLDFKAPKKSGSDRLRVGDQLTRNDMLLMTLMKSENPAAKALARTDPQGYDAFIAKMNQKARELGMTQTKFYDPSGLDSRNVASPRDLAILTSYAARQHLISRFSTMPRHNFWVNNLTSGSRTVPARSTNYMVRDGLFNLGLSKTGYIREAGKCLVVQTNLNNRPTVVVLLGANDTQTRWKDAETILKTL